MKQKRWLIRNDYDVEVVEHLAEKLNVDPVIAILLAERGIKTFEEARRFFRPSLEQLHDPFLMHDMHQAIERIDWAIQHHERIMVYGDYDVDGTSAVALLYSFLQKFTKNLDFYIPDRETEGYGISFRGIDYAHETGVKLIIALDCGIKATEQVDYATERGIDFIIGDHHLPGDTLPKAIAVLDPKRNDCSYPYKELSGCGISFKIVEAYVEHRLGVRACDSPETLDEKNRIIREKMMLELLSYLDLVAVSIASDIVPITDENRILATFGLKVINTHPRPGIEAILSYGHIAPRNCSHGENESVTPSTQNNNTSYFEKELTISDLVFLVGPRINAAGRIHSAFDSVRLLMCDDKIEATRLADDINTYNQERKEKDSTATDEAKKQIEENSLLSMRKSIVLFGEDWHKGVVGIVASRLVEAYYKPTIVFTRSTDNMYVGSARSIKEFDIHTALEQCADLLEHFGGHRCAAGVSLKPENFESFIERFESIVAASLSDQEMIPEVEVDAEISFAENLTPKFLRILKQFAPFGPENNTPVFLSRHMVDTGHARIVGKKHLKFNAIELDARSRSYPAIAFQMADNLGNMHNGKSFDLCYQLEENYWNGKTEIQLNVKDIKFEEE